MSVSDSEPLSPKPRLERRATLVRSPSMLYFLADTMQDFYLPDKQLEDVTQKMMAEMNKGLAKSTNSCSTLKMLPSFVKSVADGTEDGTFLALDLGGTNFRVLLVKLSAGGKPEMDSQIYRIPSNLMTSTGEKLFDHIALCMSRFLHRMDMHDRNLPVGFTFSFPCRQDCIDSASLITWTKGFTAEGVVGKDIVTLLREAIDRRGDDIKVRICAVVNDTVGTMMSCAYEESDCMVGLIVGTGSNCCYMEKMENIEMLSDTEGEMCINMEWGAFGDDGDLDDIRNHFDYEVDKISLNPGKQLYEKMISGMYLGEIVRLALCKLTKDKVIFDGIGSEELYTRGSFESVLVSQIEQNAPNGFHALQDILFNFNLGAVREDCEIIQHVCEAASTRAAYLCAAGIAAVARKMKLNYPEKETLNITVGVDGTVYKKHPTFGKNLANKVDFLTKDHGVKVNFALSFDGSGKGAALIAAVAIKEGKNAGR